MQDKVCVKIRNEVKRERGRDLLWFGDGVILLVHFFLAPRKVSTIFNHPDTIVKIPSATHKATLNHELFAPS